MVCTLVRESLANLTDCYYPQIDALAASVQKASQTFNRDPRWLEELKVLLSLGKI